MNQQTIFSVNEYMTIMWQWTHSEPLLMCVSRLFCQRGSNSDNFFSFSFSWWGRDGQNTTTLKVDHHRPASKAPYKKRFVCVPMMAQLRMLAWQRCDFHGIRTRIAMKSYIFVIFSEGPRSVPPPSTGSAHVVALIRCNLVRMVFSTRPVSGRNHMLWHSYKIALNLSK